jgi:hypothetical protein
LNFNRALGLPPLFRHSLSPGVHKLQAIREDGRVKRYDVTIRSQQEASLVVRW